MGPACRDEETIEALMRGGMNVARLNMSHGSHGEHRDTIQILKKLRQRLEMPVALMLDTKGPEIRLGDFPGGPVTLKAGDKFILTAKETPGDAERASMSYAALPRQVSAGDAILCNDGSVELRVADVSGEEVLCEVVRGGKIGSHKGINLPGKQLDLPFLSDSDKSDLIFGIENDVDFIAASFVRRGEDVADLRKFIEQRGGRDIKIISKIENNEGIQNFSDILRLSDGIMVARGDMGVEIEFERLPGLQKKLIRQCCRAGKPVITATQMLESMIASPSPTRAEITDIGNAVFDGTSAVMLSGETAAGAYPLRALQVMAKIAEQAERDAFEIGSYKNMDYEMDGGDTTNAVCDAACTLARDVSAKAIIALTKSGNTARSMSKFRPKEPIIAATPETRTFYQLALSWGVFPVPARSGIYFDELFRFAVQCAKGLNLLSEGDTVVIAAGLPMGVSGNTNLIKVEIV
jgi:pyruvate kinase